MGNFITRIKNYFNKKKLLKESKIRIYSEEHPGYMEFTEEEYELMKADLIIKRTEEYFFELENYLQVSQARIHELQKVMNDFK